jgi:3-phosphoshikimate 1-carboxyvinyltransferase
MSERTYPDKLEIKPLDRPPNATIRVPGSKSIMNRALVLAALNAPDGGCELRGALCSEDTQIMVACLRDLGFQVATDWAVEKVTVQRPADDIIPASDADLFVANSGTTMRFLSALVSLGHGRYRLDGVPRMRERPIEDLLLALRQLGVRSAESEHHNGCPPVIIKAGGLEGGRVRIRRDVSSQFLSAVLMVAPFARSRVTISTYGNLVSSPYVDMTAKMMEQFGIVQGIGPWWSETPINVPLGSGLRINTYDIETDATAASYFFAAALITGGTVTVSGHLPHNTLQGDLKFLVLLRLMGGAVGRRDVPPNTVCGPRKLRGITADLNAISDTVMTLAAVACFADGPTTIRNVAHIRHKETDRLAALATELRRLGAEVDEFVDGLTITPRPMHGAEVETYNDHRMAMSMALIGLKVPGVVIKNPGCVAKTYPGFWDDLEKLRS